MIIVGLTGSIGMGKSTASALLRRMNIPVHCSDEAVHDLLGAKGAAVPFVAEEFPESYQSKTKSIDRGVLGKIIFGDKEKREILESIVHPLVVDSQKDFLRQQRQKGAKLVVLDIPLLFETGAENRVDCTIVVTAPAFIQEQRVMARAGMSAEKFAAIKNTQMPDYEKRRRADFIVQTGIGLVHTRKSLQEIISILKG